MSKLRLYILVLMINCLLISNLKAQSYNTNFNKGDDAWIGGFAGCKTSDKDTILPANVAWDEITANEKDKTGLLFSINQIETNLFVYAYKQIIGLRPNSSYQIIYNTNLFILPSEGAKTERIYFKAGGLSKAPSCFSMRTIIPNFDKGELGKDGKDLNVLGIIQTSNIAQHLVFQSYTKPIQVSTNDKGELWLIMGFEADANQKQWPKIFVNAVRTIFDYQSQDLKVNLEQQMDISLNYLPKQNEYLLEGKYQNDIKNIYVYTLDGHLVKILNYSDHYLNPVIPTEDLSNGKYRLIFELNDGKLLSSDIGLK